ncbi:MAG: hypothetical protein RLO50_08985 [Azospirillaceae bacterium]
MQAATRRMATWTGTTPPEAVRAGTRRRTVALGLAALIAVSLAQSREAPAQSGTAIGAATYVDISAYRRAQAGTPVDLALRDPVFTRDFVGTAPGGGLYVTFLDGTTLTVGPDAEVALDQFVFDPGRASAFASGLNPGIKRFASGVMPEGGVRIVTPVASLGVRGTVVDTYVDAVGRSLFRLQSGAVEIGNAAGTSSALITTGWAFVASATSPVITGTVDRPIPQLVAELGLELGPFDASIFLNLVARTPFVRYEDFAGIPAIGPGALTDFSSFCGRAATAGSQAIAWSAYCTPEELPQPNDNPPEPERPPRDDTGDYN